MIRPALPLFQLHSSAGSLRASPEQPAGAPAHRSFFHSPFYTIVSPPSVPCPVRAVQACLHSWPSLQSKEAEAQEATLGLQEATSRQQLGGGMAHKTQLQRQLTSCQNQQRNAAARVSEMPTLISNTWTEPISKVTKRRTYSFCQHTPTTHRC